MLYKKMRSLTGLVVGLAITGGANAAIVLDFEGLQDLEPIQNFYNDGVGGFGSGPGGNYGVVFNNDALAIIDSDAGGSGNFGGEPSPSTAMFFLENNAVLNKADGFTTGFSFSYTAINNPGEVTVYSGLNGTGTELARMTLPITPSDGGDPTGDFSPFINAGVRIDGTAKSIRFGGSTNQIGFDNVTFGSVTPGLNVAVPFLIGDPETDPGLASRLRVNYLSKSGELLLGSFEKSAPTYVITHGWQRGGDYRDDDFSGFGLSTGQAAIQQAIIDRLAIENEGKQPSEAVNANILTFEWEGAYTGSTGSRRARFNADYAGAMLGVALTDQLGSEYDKDIHFIGHSYGTLVNGLATRFMHTQDIMKSAPDIQFTTLDTPTRGGFGAPNLASDWFEHNLSGHVDYFDNFYGNRASPEIDFNLGQELDGAIYNEQVEFDHSGVFNPFYPARVAVTTEGTAGWISPMIGNYANKPAGDFTIAGQDDWNDAITERFEAAVGSPKIATTLPGYNFYSFTGWELLEASPSAISQSLTIPFGAEWLEFDWMVDVAGDGDWFTAHFGSDLLWSMSLDELLEGLLQTTLLDISLYAGLTDMLFFTLNSVGDSGASFYVGNVLMRGSDNNSVPTVGTLPLLLAGFAGIRLAKLASRKRKKIERDQRHHLAPAG